MKIKKTNDSGTKSRPQKVLLHMAKIDGEWVGKATNFDTEQDCKFQNLKDLFLWLDKNGANARIEKDKS
jgi:hypothetical protein